MRLGLAQSNPSPALDHEFGTTGPVLVSAFPLDIPQSPPLSIYATSKHAIHGARAL
jgi:hypothetical protein